MSGDAGQVTLIFYKLGERWWKEPFLNIAAAAAQMSSFTHVEVAIGSDAGTSGEMTNVARVFNDDVGVASAPAPRTLAYTHSYTLYTNSLPALALRSNSSFRSPHGISQWNVTVVPSSGSKSMFTKHTTQIACDATHRI
jgi:hypothetical protein